MTVRVLFAALLAPATALAHPGHGESAPESWLHYLTEPVHVVVLAAVGAIAVVGGVRYRSARRRATRDDAS